MGLLDDVAGSLTQRYRRLYMRLHRIRVDMALDISMCLIAESLALIGEGLAKRTVRDLLNNPATILQWIYHGARVAEAVELDGRLAKDLRDHVSSANKLLAEFVEELDFMKKAAQPLRLNFVTPEDFRKLASLATQSVNWAPLAGAFAGLAELASLNPLAKLLAAVGLAVPGLLWGILALELAAIAVRARVVNRLYGKLRRRQCYTRVREIIEAIDSLVPGP